MLSGPETPAGALAAVARSEVEPGRRRELWQVL